MSQIGQNLSRTQGRAWLALVAVLCLASLGGFWWLRTPAPAPATPAMIAPLATNPPVAARPADNAAPSPPPAAPAAAPAEIRPSFDIVRVGPQGNAVIAGRAAPNAEVIVRNGDHELGRTRADDRGQWVLTPDQPLSQGQQELTLEARPPSGAPTRGDASVLLVIPAHPASPAPVAPSGQQTARLPAQPSEAGPLAVLVPNAADATPRLLQAPGGTRTGLGLDVIDYDEHGAIRFAGHAPPDAAMRLYVDNAPRGDATADAQGAWSLSPRGETLPGRHTLRVDQIGSAGQVLARIEVPFEREQQAQAAAGQNQIVVQPGQNLWRIARQAYGQGTRYTVIFAANRDHIRDPRLIYPGQAFAIPQH